MASSYETVVGERGIVCCKCGATWNEELTDGNLINGAIPNVKCPKCGYTAIVSLEEHPLY